jgi:4-phytase / acid phosphatase
MFTVPRHLRISFLCFCLALCFYFVCTARSQSAPESNDELRSVIVLTRHGVRTPIESETRGGAYNAQPWPSWPVPPGVLTPHGTSALRLMGEYYRSRYPSLLQHVSCASPGIYVEANTTQRTIASAKALLTGLVPECAIEVHFRPNQRNPLFSPADNSAIDHEKLAAATEGRRADQPEWFTNAFARPLARMHQVLTDCSGADCDKSKPDFRTAVVSNGVMSERSAKVESPVSLGADFAENFLLEYTEGLPMSQVGWGRVSREDLNDLMEMNTRYHDFILRTPYSAQVAASDLAAHIRDTILGAAAGKVVPGQLGTEHDRFVLLDGHDSNLTWLGGLLRLGWLLQDQTFNATPPGSALVFEVHRNRTTNAFTVQVLFISQTLDQMRDLRPLTGTEQPSIAPVFVPGCSASTPGYPCSVEDFSKVISSAIDSRLVESTTK